MTSNRLFIITYRRETSDLQRYKIMKSVSFQPSRSRPFVTVAAEN